MCSNSASIRSLLCHDGVVLCVLILLQLEVSYAMMEWFYIHVYAMQLYRFCFKPWYNSYFNSASFGGLPSHD